MKSLLNSQDPAETTLETDVFGSTSTISESPPLKGIRLVRYDFIFKILFINVNFFNSI